MLEMTCRANNGFVQVDVSLPCSDDEFLTFGTSIGVQVMSHDKKHDLARHVTVALVLARSGTQTENEKEVPRHAHLEEHLEIQDTKQARVKLGAHEEIINWVASHAMLLAAPDGRDICDNADEEAAQNGNREKGAKLVNGIVQRPDTGEVKDGENSQGEVQGDESVAIVLELFATFVGQWLSPAPDTWQKTVASTLEDEIRPVPEPSFGVGERASVDIVDELRCK